MTEGFPKLMSDTKPQIQEAQRTPSRKVPPNLHSVISFSKYRKIRDTGKHPQRGQKEKNILLIEEQIHLTGLKNCASQKK